MNTIITFLSQVKLTLQQYALLTMAVIIGALVITLRLQGGQLHAAQIALLEQHYAGVNKEDDEAVANAKARLAVAKAGL